MKNNRLAYDCAVAVILALQSARIVYLSFCPLPPGVALVAVWGDVFNFFSQLLFASGYLYWAIEEGRATTTAPTCSPSGGAENDPRRKPQSPSNEWHRHSCIWGHGRENLSLAQESIAWRGLLRAAQQTQGGRGRKTLRWLQSWAIPLSVRTALALLSWTERMLPPALRVPPAPSTPPTRGSESNTAPVHTGQAPQNNAPAAPHTPTTPKAARLSAAERGIHLARLARQTCGQDTADQDNAQR